MVNDQSFLEGKFDLEYFDTNLIVLKSKNNAVIICILEL